MANYSWKSAVNGDWLNAADWAGGTVPDNADAAVTIGAVGHYAVTIGASEDIQIEYLTLKAANATLDVLGSLQSDAIFMKGNDDTLAFYDDQTLNDGLILSGSNQILALGSALTLGVPDFMTVSGDTELGGTTIVNNDEILVESGGMLTIDSKMFENIEGGLNTGLTIKAGATLALLSPGFQNAGFIIGSGKGISLIELAAGSSVYAGGTLSGGQFGEFEASPGNTLALEIQNNGSIVTDNTLLFLVDKESEIETVNPKTGTAKNIDLTLATISSGGRLWLFDKASFDARNDFDVSGEIYLDKGYFSAPALDISSGGEVEGSGRVKGAITNDGTIIAYGKLEITNSISGTGSLAALNRGQLQLDEGTSENVSLSGYGKLILEDPAQFTGTLSPALGANFVIDIAPTTVSAATISGDSLLITLTGGATLDYALAQNLSNAEITIKSDNKTGSAIVVRQPANAASAALDYSTMQFMGGGTATVAGASQNTALPDLGSELMKSTAANAASFVASTFSARGLQQALSLTDRAPSAFVDLLAKAGHFLS